MCLDIWLPRVGWRGPERPLGHWLLECRLLLRGWYFPPSDSQLFSQNLWLRAVEKALRARVGMCL